MSHYSRAPITEALIDIRVRGSEPTIERLADLQGDSLDAYPEKKALHLASIEFAAPTPGEVPSFANRTSKQRGWAFVAADKLQVWQVHFDGFTFSRLSPYQSWAPFRDEAQRLWNYSRPVYEPIFLTRIAVRYINRLELPLPLKDFNEFLRTVPEVSPELPQGVSTFFMQLQIPQIDIGAMLVLNQQLLPGIAKNEFTGTVPIILDIDLYKDQEVPQDEREIWGFFEQLHSKKNAIFEGCITDKLRDLIK